LLLTTVLVHEISYVILMLCKTSVVQTPSFSYTAEGSLIGRLLHLHVHGPFLCIHSSCLILNLVDTTFDSKPFATGATQYYFVFAHSKHGGRKSSDTDTSPGNVSVSQAFSNTAQLMSRSNTARSCFGLSPGHSIDLFSSPCPYVPLGYIGF